MGESSVFLLLLVPERACSALQLLVLVFLSAWLAQEFSGFLHCHLLHALLLRLTCAAAAAPATVRLNGVVGLGIPYGPLQARPFYDSVNYSV